MLHRLTPSSMRAGAGIAMVLAAALWLMGLGGGTDSGSQSNIPIPAQNYTVKVTDGTGQTLEARRFTWEGKVFFRGQVGNATVSLPFNKVRALKAEGVAGSGETAQIKASITLRDGDTVQVMMDRTTKAYGETKFGDYEIFIKDVASIEFQ